MKYDFNEILSVVPGLKFSPDEDLRPHSSFKIGGKADVLIEPKSVDELKGTLRTLKDGAIPYMIIGRASNILFSDEGFRGAIIKFGREFSKISSEGNLITADAGTSLSELAVFACKESLCGLECLSGIPGTVGGAVFMNAGAYGGEIKDVLKFCTILDENFEEKMVTLSELELGHRTSILQKKPYILVTASFELEKADKGEIRAKMDDFNARRKDKQPLSYPSCGSAFKRPKEGYASQMIDECGLKGVSYGGARVSEKHAGFIINYDNATADDVKALIDIVKKIVYDKKGVLLETEIRIL